MPARRRWIVKASGDELAVTDPAGDIRSLALEDLSRVVIETNDSGPFGDDVWWLLVGRDDKVAVSFPQSAEGEHAAVETLLKLPHFDYETMITAMGAVRRDFYPVWQRPNP